MKKKHESPLVLTGLEALAAMRMGVSYFHTISCRFFTMRVRPLSISEQLQVAADCRARVMSNPNKHMQTEMQLEAEIAKETLMLASTSDIGMSDFQITNAVLSAMTVAELMFLFKEYNHFVESLDPSLLPVPDDRIGELLEAVKKNPAHWTELSRSELVKVAQECLRTAEDLQGAKSTGA